MISKMIAALPLNSRMETLTYLEESETCPERRRLDDVIQMLDTRYGRTDSEKAWAWLTGFTNFRREPQENYKDFWTRYSRCVTRLEAHGMGMKEEVVFHRALQALRLPEGQLPIVLATLETFPSPHSVQALKALTIKMFETHKNTVDSSEVYQTQVNSRAEAEDGDGAGEEEFEFTDGDGAIYLMRPKKNSKPKNSPGTAESARRGSIQNFAGMPNVRKTPLMCIRCGSRDHFVKDCPHPWVSELNPKFASNSAKRVQFVNNVDEPTTSEIVPDSTMNQQPGSNPMNTVCTENVDSDLNKAQSNLETDSQEALYKMWENYYAKTGVEMTQVCSVFLNQNAPSEVVQGHEIMRSFPLILLDSGASRSVAGKKRG